jgi:hypothetical protein
MAFLQQEQPHFPKRVRKRNRSTGIGEGPHKNEFLREQGMLDQ